MTQNKLFRRLCALMVTLAMLVPCVLTVPVSAAGGATPLFSWTASDTTAANMQAIKDNLTQSSTLSDTHWLSVVTASTASGSKRFLSHILRNSASENGYGLDSYTVDQLGETKIVPSESLQLEFNDGYFTPVETAGKAAVNLKLGYTILPELLDTPAFALDKLKVQVNVGGTWLDGGVGMRSWELVGFGKDSKDRDVYFLELETENFMNISGLNAGDTIQNVRILPHGDFYYTFGWFGLNEVTVNGYETVADFDAAVPNERADLLNVGEAAMRDIVIAEAQRIADLEWTTDQQFVAGLGNVNYYPGVQYRGVPYSRNMKPDFEIMRDYYVNNGVYVGSYTEGEVAGMDCMSFVYDLYSRVSRSYSFVLWQTQSDNALQLLGDLESATNAVFTDKDIIEHNSDTAMYNAYAQIKKGDVLASYKADTGSAHVRVSVENAHVEYSSGTTVDPDKSYVIVTEQAGALDYFFLNSAGDVVSVDGYRIKSAYNEITAADIAAYASSNGYTFLYSSSVLMAAKYTFAELYEVKYVPYTLKEYSTGKVEAADVQMLLQPKDYEDITSGFRAVAASDHHVSRMGITLRDTDTNAVVYEDEVLYSEPDDMPHQRHYLWNYENAELDTKLAALPKGNYSIDVAMLTGPVTTAGVDRSEVTESYEFSVNMHDHSSWTSLNDALSGFTVSTDNIVVPEGKYYLSGDLELTDGKYLNIAGDTTLCLNGYTLDAGACTKYILRVAAGVTLDLCDCSDAQTGKLTGLEASGNDSYSAIIIAGGTVNLRGGTITGNNSPQAVRVGTAASTLNMKGGSITGNTATKFGAVHTVGDFNMYSGIIADNTVPDGKGQVTTSSDGTFNQIGGNVGHVHACTHAHVGTGQWKPLSDAEGFASGLIAGGKYYLTEDTTLSNFLDLKDGDVTLCLNGYKLDSKANDSYIIRLYSNNLDICDCSTEKDGVIGDNWASSGGTTNGAILVRANCTLNMYGGTITGVTNSKQAVYVAGTFNMHDGTIAGNTVTKDVKVASGGTFNLIGGDVGHAHSCAHDHVSTGEWKSLNDALSSFVVGGGNYKMTGGKYYLEDDITLENYLYLSNGDVTLCLNGYKLIGAVDNPDTTDAKENAYIINTNTYNLDICDCSAEKSGVIGDNWASSGGTTNGAILVRANCTVNMYGGTITGVTGKQAVYVAGTFNMHDGTIAGNTVTKAVNVADGGTFNPIGGNVENHAHNCTHTHVGDGEWLPLNEAENFASGRISGGKYYLTEDTTLSNYLDIRNGDVTLCLNGFKLDSKANDSYIINAYSNNLDICDCSAEKDGVIGGNWTSKDGDANAAIIVRTGCTLNMYGGTITGVTAPQVVYVPANGTFNMHGGAITGNNTTKFDAVYVKGTFNMYGGEISGNTVPNGKAQVGGTGAIDIDGGTVIENVCDHAEDKLSTVAGKAATCTETGLTEGKVCSCGEVVVAQKEIPALGHTEEVVAGKDATCTETGLTAGVKCSVCGEVLVAQEEIPMADHTEEIIPGKDATCTETGLTEGKKCSVCGETIVAQETIEALGHNMETIPAQAPTTESIGWNEYEKCSVCGHTEGYVELPVLEPEPETYTVTIAEGIENGTVEVDVTEAAEGETVTVTVTANEGYAIGEVKANDEVLTGENGVYTFTVTADTTVTATFTVKAPQGSIGGMSPTLELASEVFLNFYCQVNGFEGIDLETQMGLLVWTGSGEYSEAEFTIDNENVVATFGAKYRDYDGRWAVKTPGISAKNLGDDRYMRVVVKTGENSYEYCKIISYSPAKYALDRLKKSDDENLKKVMVGLMDYGAAAQVFTGHRTESLANAFIDSNATYSAYRTEYSADMIKAVVNADTALVDTWVRDSAAKAIWGVTPSLIMEGIITNNFRAQFKKTGILSGNEKATFKFWNQADYEAMVEGNVKFADATPTMIVEAENENNYFVGGYNRTAAKNLGDSLYMCVEIEANGTIYRSGIISYSAHAYLADRIAKSADPNMVDLAKKMASYSDAAATYFANRD